MNNIRPPQIFECVVEAILREVGLDEFMRSMKTTKSNLQHALQTIRNAYSDCNQRRFVSTDLKYSLPQFRAAYIYGYGTSHVNMVYNEWKFFLNHVPNIIVDNIMTKAEFSDYYNEPLEVCCIGGGPATDAIALQLFLNDQMNFSGSMAVTVMDKWTSWKESANELVYQVNSHLSRCCITKLDYDQFDFFNDNPLYYNALMNADIISISKFVSVVSQDQSFCQEKLVEIFNAIKPGAIIFFYENSAGGYDTLFNDAAYEANLFMLAENTRHTTVVCQTEQSVMVPLAGQNPQRKASVISSLWIK